MNEAPTSVDNYINGTFVPPSTNQYLDVLNPSNSQVIGKVALSSSSDVDQAVQVAHQAQQAWAKNTTIKQRAALMLKFHALIQEHAHELAALIVKENGKNMTEALADVAKGNETVEWACSLPQVAPGRNLQVSGQVYCQDRREPLGVVASIVPFNFVSLLLNVQHDTARGFSITTLSFSSLAFFVALHGPILDDARRLGDGERCDSKTE